MSSPWLTVGEEGGVLEQRRVIEAEYKWDEWSWLDGPMGKMVGRNRWIKWRYEHRRMQWNPDTFGGMFTPSGQIWYVEGDWQLDGVELGSSM
jgi:hypothetical protein